MNIIEKTITTVTVSNTITEAPEWVKLTLEGQKINAIKKLRRITAEHVSKPIGLREAKVIVDSLTMNQHKTLGDVLHSNFI